MPKLTPIPKFEDLRVVAEDGVLTIEIDPDQPDKDIANMKLLFDRAIEARRAFDDEFNEVVDSGNLTEDGKRTNVVQLAETTLSNIRGENLIGVADQHHAELLDSIRFKPATLDVRQFERTANPTVSAAAAAGRHAALAVREVEVRQWLFTQDDLKRAQVFNDAVDTRDELLFGAFANAPVPIRADLLSREMFKSGLERWEANVHPDAAKKVKALRRAIDLAKNAQRGLESHVRGAANVPDSFAPVVLGRG